MSTHPTFKHQLSFLKPIWSSISISTHSWSAILKYRCFIWDLLTVSVLWSLSLSFSVVSIILSTSSSAVPMLVAVCLWSSAPGLCHHMVRVRHSSQIPTSTLTQIKLVSKCILIVFFCLFQSDIFPFCTVLHQQSICRPLPSSCSHSNASQGCQQGKKEELKNLMDLVYQSI